MATGKDKNGVAAGVWLDRKATAKYIGLSDFWLQKHACSGLGPRYIQHGRKVWYRRDDLDTWLAEQSAVVAHGAGGKSALDKLWEMGKRRRVQTPDVVALESRYEEEHGEPPKVTPANVQLWKRLYHTLDAEQRALLAQMEEHNG